MKKYIKIDHFGKTLKKQTNKQAKTEKSLLNETIKKFLYYMNDGQIYPKHEITFKNC